MRHSDIFDGFIKIAEERGLVSLSEKEESSHKHDFDEIKSIEELYDIKFDSPDDMKYENNISELAHKDSLVISPAYDKLNGLVENINERQNIMLNIVNKDPNGQLTNHKYAENQLTLALVRIASSLDAHDEDELRALGDSCLENITLVKKANPLAIAGAFAAVIGAVYAHQHLPNLDRGYKENYRRLQAEIDDLLEGNSNFGIGYDLDSVAKKNASDLKSKLFQFNSAYLSCKSVIDDLEVPRTAKELKEIANTPETKEINNAVTTLKDLSEDCATFINQIKQNFSSKTYRESHIDQKGAITSLLDNTFLHGGNGLVADDFGDVVNAITPYLNSVNEIIKVLSDAGSRSQSAKTKIESIIAKREETPKADINPGGSSRSPVDSLSDPSSLEKAMQETKL